MAAGLARQCRGGDLHRHAGGLKVLPGAPHAPQVPVIVRTQDDPTWTSCGPPAPPKWCRGHGRIADAGRRCAASSGDRTRDARYNLLRGYFHGADDDTVNERDHENGWAR